MDAQEPTCTKVYYTSRTHSQLAQVIGELHRLRISATAPRTSDGVGEHAPTVRAVSLGSRKQLCINKPLTESGGDLDEKCRELLTGSLRLSVSTYSTDQAKEEPALGAGSSRHGKMKRSSLNLETRFWYHQLLFSS